jgi:hypothetical protein
MQTTTDTCFTCMSRQELAAIDRELARLRQQQSRQRQRERSHHLCPFAIAVTVAVWALSDYQHALAQAFAVSNRGKRGRRDEPLLVEPDWKAVIEEWYMAVKSEDVLAFHFPTSPKQQRVKMAADKFLAEMAVVDWVKDLNLRQGVAPASASLALNFIDRKTNSGQSESMKALRYSVSEGGNVAGRTARKWSLRFRKRFHIGFGTLKVREEMPEAEVHDKAACIIDSTDALARDVSVGDVFGMFL